MTPNRSVRFLDSSRNSKETLEQQDSSQLAKERVKMNKPSNKNTLREETQPQARPTSSAIKIITIARQQALQIPGTPKRLSGTTANGRRPAGSQSDGRVNTKPTVSKNINRTTPIVKKSNTNTKRTLTGTQPVAVLSRTKSARGNPMLLRRHGAKVVIFAQKSTHGAQQISGSKFEPVPTHQQQQQQQQQQ